MGGWTGAGWWQPCSEVCTAGRSRAEMKTLETFKQFQACESNCRKTKAGQLKKVIAHVKEVVAQEGGPTRGPAGGNRAMPPPHMMAQRVSKHLLKWAETQGLPKKLADNPKDAAKVGQSVTGMLIAGWSQAGWWQPCGQVCRYLRHICLCLMLYVCMCVYACVHACVCVRACVCACVRACVCVCVRACGRAWFCVHACVYVCVYMYAGICV